jgi:hypothetical protein
MKYEVHVSDIRAFKTCRRQWNWSSPLGHNLEPDKPYAPFFSGRVVHTALELYYRSNGNMTLMEAVDVAFTIEYEKMESAGTLWEEEEQMLNEQKELVYGIMEHYDIWIHSGEHNKSPWGDENLEYLDMETTFTVPMLTENGNPSNRVYLGGRFDGIVRRRDDGTLWLFETKTTRSIKELQNTLAFDEQAGAYIYAAQLLLGEQVYGVIYNILRKKVPTTPRLLQNGTLSVNKSIDTTASYYLRAAMSHHQDMSRENLIELYNEILMDLHERGNLFFSRTIIRRTPGEIAELADNLWYVALEMVRPSTKLYPSPSWTSCTFCRFRAPCLAVNTGADVSMLLENEYRERKDREFRPYLLYGFYFVPIADDRISVWYYGQRIVKEAPDMDRALAATMNWIVGRTSSVNGYYGPDPSELLRGAEEVGLWHGE